MSNEVQTIIILANALCVANACDIRRMDIQYNSVLESYGCRVWLGKVGDTIEDYLIYNISEDGQIDKVKEA